MQNKNNVIPADQFKAACKLSEMVTWLENNRHHFVAILQRDRPASCHDTVLREMRNLNYELGQWLSALRGR